MLLWLAGTALGANVVDIAVGDGRFETLTQALTAADLVETLQGPGPFTVFAPTDDAFAALPPQTLPTLLDPANRDLLQRVLTFHVASGRVEAADVRQRGGVKSLAGQRIDVSAGRKSLEVEGARIVVQDIVADNGVIHVIDAVMVPEQRPLSVVARDAGSFGTLLAAAEAAGLLDVLAGNEPYTIFAPTDEAFRALPAGTVEDLLKPENRGDLRNLLTYHVVPGFVFADDVARRRSLTTVQGEGLPVQRIAKRLAVGGRRIVKADIEAANGVVHVIDGVLTPPAPSHPVAKVIDAAIARGAPLYNHGNPRACLAVYEVAARALLELGGSQLSSDARARIARGLTDA
ncbi:MAG: fasciclin domain-containing protein, partial [Myxococcota bacterium]